MQWLAGAEPPVSSGFESALFICAVLLLLYLCFLRTVVKHVQIRLTGEFHLPLSGIEFVFAIQWTGNVSRDCCSLQDNDPNVVVVSTCKGGLVGVWTPILKNHVKLNLPITWCYCELWILIIIKSIFELMFWSSDSPFTCFPVVWSSRELELKSGPVRSLLFLS